MPDVGAEEELLIDAGGKGGHECTADKLAVLASDAAPLLICCKQPIFLGTTSSSEAATLASVSVCNTTCHPAVPPKMTGSSTFVESASSRVRPESRTTLRGNSGSVTSSRMDWTVKGRKSL